MTGSYDGEAAAQLSIFSTDAADDREATTAVGGHHEQERLARAALTRLGEPGDLRIASLVADVGAEQAWRLLVDQDVRVPYGNREVGTVRDDVCLRAADVDAAADLERAAELGIRFLVPGDPEWPGRLEDLHRAGAVQRRGGPPLGLWVRGRPLTTLVERAVAFVGSRSATGYGTTTGAEIAAHVSREGYGVVSGAAFGIDQATHRAALAVEGGTVAVLACGVDRAYPSAHEQLLEKIGERGAVVSELPPGCAPTRVRFLARNRLIAALSEGTVVVEAAVRSGALNTAHWTTRLHRPLMGVPGAVTSAASAGVHELIRTRDATLVTSGEHVLDLLGGPEHAAGLARGAETVRDQLPRHLREVLEGVPVTRAITTRSVAREVAVSEAIARDSLAELSARGLVEHGDGRWRLSAGARADAEAGTGTPTVDW
ncbi:DNA-processing protein DprA [Nocardioidaceae bacterium]|nr:DNA-processing protein DprA [Nocardioidaceae bacterium]